MLRANALLNMSPNEPPRYAIYMQLCMWVVWAVALQPTPKTITKHPCVHSPTSRPAHMVLHAQQGINLHRIVHALAIFPSHYCRISFATRRIVVLCALARPPTRPCARPRPAPVAFISRRPYRIPRNATRAATSLQVVWAETNFRPPTRLTVGSAGGAKLSLRHISWRE